MSVARLKRPRIGPRSAGVLMTPEEFDDLPEHRWVPGYRYELINGVLVVSPHSASAERGPNDDLGHLLWTYRESDPRGAALDGTLPQHSVLSAPNRRRCDRAIWVGLGRQPAEESDIPSIVVEFVAFSKSDKHRDDQVKREEYRLAGVKEYWIIDRFRRRMTSVQSLEGGTAEVIIDEGQSYQTDLLPGFVLPLTRLLSKADAWPTLKRRRRPRTGDSR